MMSNSEIKKHGEHKNYGVLNLIGYGLAKFNMGFVAQFKFKTKVDFYSYIVSHGIAETIGVVKNRQDLFDNFFDNGRKGWWQKGDTYIHRKIFIDSLFGDLDEISFANIVKLHIEDEFFMAEQRKFEISPIIKSKFKQLQTTGLFAESFFMNNFQKINCFKGGVIEDARMFGDGYDFQINVHNKFFLAEIKGLQKDYGGIRMTKNEFKKASEVKNNYALVVVSNIQDIPMMKAVLNPIKDIDFTKKIIDVKQVSYHTRALKWRV